MMLAHGMYVAGIRSGDPDKDLPADTKWQPGDSAAWGLSA